jgi:hypothetical protein
MSFAKIIFRIAGVWGLLILTPLYFFFDRIGREYPPPITHPDFYYGFIGVALVWQIAFLTIGSNPIRYRPLTIAAMLEKLVALPDFVLASLFVVACLKTPARPDAPWS